MSQPAAKKTAWSLDESQTAQDMRSKGKTLQQIGNAVGRPFWSVYAHFRVLDDRAFVEEQKARQKAPPKTRLCQVCRKTFTPQNAGIVYCGQACRTKSYTHFQHL